MDGKLTALAISDPAILADKGFFPSMGIDVLLVILLGTEALAAVFAYELILSQVGEGVVSFHVKLVSVLFLAVWASSNLHPRFHFFPFDWVM